MFSSLRSRLLLSYTLVIAAVLVVITFALLAVSALSTADRGVATLRQLAAVSTGIRRTLAQIRDGGAVSDATVAATLDEIALEQQTRILLIRSATLEVIYDSQDEASWVGQRLSDLATGERLTIGAADGPVAGRLQAPNGAIWLVYAPATPDRALGTLSVVVAQPEPSAIAYFNETFFRPLCSAGVVAFLLAIVLAIVLTRSVAGPLQRLAGAASAIAEGDLDQRVPPSGPNEVRLVATSFNDMAAQVQASQQAQRDFVANVSHDLKTPLTSMRGWSQAMLEGMIETPQQRSEAATIIHSEAERMTRMVNQLLDLARIDAGQLALAREPVDLSDLLRQVQANLALPARVRNIDVQLVLRQVPPVPGDPDRLVQVFTNLVDNAIRYTPGGGRVRLRLEPHGASAVDVLVEDNGPGLSATELGRIFERFYQVDKSRTRRDDSRGAGLGLAITRELVEAHGGRIEVRSQPGLGTAFLVRLPTDGAEGPGAARRL